MTPQPPPPAPPLRLRVFLASPGDVTDERALALKVLERLPYDPFLRGRILVETIAWDKPGADTPMLATLTPQEAIAQQRPKPSECDIVIVILWSRMGTPLPPEYSKPDGGTYLSGTEWEYLDARGASKKTGRPKVLVYRRTEEPRFGAYDPEIGEKLAQLQLVNTFFESFRSADGSIRGGVNEYDTPDAFDKKLTEHLKEIVQTLLTEHQAKVQGPTAEPTSDATQAPESPEAAALWEGSPFPGLRAFGEDDAPIYFGRGRETDGLIRRLDEDSRFITVVGVSGSGKSSLVAAGLLPRLKDNAIPGSRDWLRVRFTPGELGANPFIALASSFKSAMDRHGRKVRDEAKRMEADPSVLDELVGLMLQDRPKWAELLLFVDQFEELFTVVDAKYRGPFGALLAHAAKLPRLRTVATLRADFYHRCVEQPALAELLRTGSYPLAAPGVGALYEMIARPAGRAGLAFEDGLPERILDDTGTEPGALPLMAFALSELYEARTNDRQLTHDAYDGFEGVQGAIGKRAEDTFLGLEESNQAALEGVFRELVEVDETGSGWVATRRRALRAKVAATPAAETLVKAFVEARLLLPGEGEDGTPLLEVAHEALLRNWRRLADWIEHTGADLSLLRQLRRSAGEWQERTKGKGDLLWPRRRRRQAQAMLHRLQPALEVAEQGFIDASAARTRRLAWVIAAGALVLGIFVASWISASFGLASVDLQIAWLRAKLGMYIEPEMVAICGAERTRCTEGQSFLMGSPDGEGSSDEQPQHPVTFSRGYRIGIREVTFAEYDIYALSQGKRLPSDQGWGRGDRPVIDVNWYEVRDYAAWLSTQTDRTYRLPSEAEWAYAARAGTTTRYWWGDDIQEKGKVWANCNGCGSEWDGDRTALVGSFPANPWGLHDTAGNVWEWVQDCWHSNYQGAPDDGSVWEEKDCDRRVLRGGAWGSGPGSIRSAARYGNGADDRGSNIGFRLAQDP